MEEERLIAQFRQANRFFRARRPVEDSCTRCDPFRQGGLLEIAVPALRCRHDAEGGCIMCNYGTGTPPLQAELETQFNACLSAMGPELKTLLLSTNGSFLDDGNVPSVLQEALLRRAQACAAATIIVETHLDTLRPEKLQFIRRLIPQKTVILEIGLESVNPFVQKNCYLKEINLDTLKRIMENGKKLDILFQLNVILGAPFLRTEDQIEDAEQAIRWALAHGAMTALFPMNIKPYTLLYYAYGNELYPPVSHWAVPLLLSCFTSGELARIDLAWYGNRQIQYARPGTSTVFPMDCPACRESLRQFYHAYVETGDGVRRRQLVKDVIRAGEELCDCLNKVRSARHRGVDRLETQVWRLQRSLAAALARDGII